MPKTSLPSLLRACVACGFLFSASADAQEYNVVCISPLLSTDVTAAFESGLRCPKQAIKCSEERTMERQVLNLALGGRVNMKVPYYLLKIDDSVVEALKAKKKLVRIAGDKFVCGIPKSMESYT